MATKTPPKAKTAPNPPKRRTYRLDPRVSGINGLRSRLHDATSEALIVLACRVGDELAPHLLALEAVGPMPVIDAEFDEEEHLREDAAVEGPDDLAYHARALVIEAKGLRDRINEMSDRLDEDRAERAAKRIAEQEQE